MLQFLTKNVNSWLTDQLVETERQCWMNGQYSWSECLEVVGIPTSLKDDALEDQVVNIFWENYVEIGQCGIQACRNGKNNRIVVKFSNRKNCIQILRVKKQLKYIDCTLFNFPNGTKIFVNKSLCPYYKGLWHKCKVIKNKNKLHQFYIMGRVIRVKLVEYCPVKNLTHISNLEELFSDINIDDLFFFILSHNMTSKF